jgi:aspartate/methionine/tyrosine aminotransferase
MRPEEFKLERYFARYEFTTRFLLCSSDGESLPIGELLAYEEGARGRLERVWLGYTESRGDPELINAIASLYERVRSEGILVHAGAQEAIFAFINCVLEAGDHVIVQFPAYQSQYSIALANGASVSQWRADLAGEGAPDPDELEALIRPETRALVVTTPNNPTGYVFDRARLERVVAITRKRGLWLFSDEVYRGSERSTRDRHPSVCDLYERGVSLGGLAKAHGLAGLRIAWIATQDAALVRRLAAFKDYLTICNSAPSEFLAALALRHSDRLLERLREITVANLDLLDAYFARNADLWQWRRPRAGTTAFPRYVPGDTDRLCAQLVENVGVLLLPSSVFEAGTDRVRIGYGRRNLPDALAALETFVDVLGSGPRQLR